MTSMQRVLVVEDHAPFRRLMCGLLRQRSDLRIVGEAVDGWDAVCQAEALQPDVVVLDIGLPHMSGLEAASRIRQVLPETKLMFVTIESSPDVVEQAFQRGAHGYVYKPRAHRDVLPVLDAIIRGGRFVSGGLARIAQGDSLATHRHHLLFWTDDTVVVDAFSRFIATGLNGGNTVIAIMSSARAEAVHHIVRAEGVNVDCAVRELRYVPVEMNELIASASVNGSPDPARMFSISEALVADAVRQAASRHARVIACGEGAPALWVQGHPRAAIELEHLWDEFAKTCQMDILCAYPLAVRSDVQHMVTSLCAEHTTVEIR